MADPFQNKIKKVRGKRKPTVDDVFKSFADGLKDTREVSFKRFIRKVYPRYEFYWFLEELIERLEAVANGELKRLACFMPPRHGKSLTISQLFPAYFLNRHADLRVGLATYGAILSREMSEKARNFYLLGGGSLDPASHAKDNWSTHRGGGMWASGVGGTITGKGYHVGIVDDPLKNEMEAYSPLIRQRQKDWWRATWSTRNQPDAALILMQTRWVEDDLGGWLMSQLDPTDQESGWEILNFQAIKEQKSWSFPENCKVFDDPREDGEALCPERYPLKELEKRKEAYERTDQMHFWNALYQQDPRPKEGNIWKRKYFDKWFNDWDELPVLYDVGWDWDTAYSDNENNAATAFVLTGHDRQGTVYLMDLNWFWLEDPELVDYIEKLTFPHRFKCVGVGVHYIENRANGKTVLQRLKRRIGSRVKPGPPIHADKVTRTQLITPFVAEGNLVVREDLLPILLDDEEQGILNFPNKELKDLNDAFVQALYRHTQKRQVSVNTLNISVA